MISQPELFDTARTDGPKVTGEEIRLLADILRGKGWLTARKIAGFMNEPCFRGLPSDPEPALENFKRRIRAIANASHGQIMSYPGSPGYKLTREATPDEEQIAVAKLRHQAKEMAERAMEIERVFHAKL